MAMQLLRYFILSLFTLFIAAIVILYIFIHWSKPSYSGETALNGLTNKAEVLFDSYGIPHIYAKSEEDAFFSLGYVHAQERLFQMEMLRRIGSGRLSEILGKELLEADCFFRTLGIAKHAEESEKLFMSENSEPYQKLSRAYLNGINQYIEKGKTPLEFTLLGIPKEKFTPLDMYLISGYMSYSFSLTLRTEPLLTRIGQNFGTDYLKDVMTLPPGFVAGERGGNQGISEKNILLKKAGLSLTEIFDELLPVPPWLGSNCWVLAPHKTKSGKVLFCNDTHIGYAQPAVWYEAHLECPGLSLYGNFLAGFPFPLVGHNSHTAIGLTMFENDDMDLFREKSNPANPDQVWVNDHWENMTILEETIKIKNEKDTLIKVKLTRHGPVMNEVVKDIAKSEDEPVSAWWVFTKFPAKTLQTAYLFSHAATMEEIRLAASMVHAPGLNVMYGDSAGNIAWWAAARLVKRPPHVASKLILDGASGKDEPLGYYDFSENPSAVNPLCGFVFSANNQPDTLKDGCLYPGYYVPQDRANSIVSHLSSEKKWDAEDMKKMITDGVSATYPLLAREILGKTETGILKKTSHHKMASEILRNWSGNHAPEDIAPTIFYKIQYLILHYSLSDEMGEEDFQSFLFTHQVKEAFPTLVYNDSSLWWDNRKTEKLMETRSDIFNLAFDSSIVQLQRQLGENMMEWKWKKVHRIEHIHPIGRKEPFDRIFNVGPYPIGGGNEVINNVGFTLNETGDYKARYGPAMRRIIDFNSIENSWSVLPTGQSGNLMSKHYSDQAKMYNKGIFRKQKMNKDEIEADCKGRLLLSPAYEK